MDTRLRRSSRISMCGRRDVVVGGSIRYDANLR